MIEPLADQLAGYFHYFGVQGGLLMQLGRSKRPASRSIRRSRSRIRLPKPRISAFISTALAESRRHEKKYSATCRREPGPRVLGSIEGLSIQPSEVHIASKETECKFSHICPSRAAATKRWISTKGGRRQGRHADAFQGRAGSVDGHAGSKDKVMHAAVRIGDTQVLMSDGRCHGSRISRASRWRSRRRERPTPNKMFTRWPKAAK